MKSITPISADFAFSIILPLIPASVPMNAVPARGGFGLDSLAETTQGLDLKLFSCDNVRMSFRRIKKRIIRIFWRLAVLVAGILLVGYVWVCTYGVPRPLLDRIEQRLSRGSISVEIDTVKLSPNKGVMCRQFRMFRKGVADGPTLTINRASADISYRHLIAGAFVVQSLHAREVILHPSMFKRPPNPPAYPQRVARATTPWINVPCSADLLDVAGCKLSDPRALLRFGPGKYEVINATYTDDAGRVHVDADVFIDTFKRNIRTAVEGTIAPKDILPLLKNIKADAAHRIVSAIEATDDLANVELTSSVDKVKPSREIDITARIENPRLAGVNTKSLQFDLTFRGRNHIDQCILKNCSIARADGAANFSLSWMNSAKALSFTGISNLNPLVFLKALVKPFPKQIEAIAFGTPPTIVFQGSMITTNQASFKLKTDLKASKVKVEKIPLETIELMSVTDGPKTAIEDIRIETFSGTVTGSVHLAQEAPETPYRFETQLIARDIRFGDLLTAFSITNNFGGELSSRLSLSGTLRHQLTETLRGSGKIRIKDGELFRLPLFAGLTPIMAKLIPGLNFLLCQSDAKMDLSLRDNAIKVDRAILQGDVFSFKGEGEYHFTKHLDLAIQFRLLRPDSLPGKIFSVITFPLTKLLEFRVKGPLNRAEWYPQNFKWVRREREKKDGDGATKLKDEVLILE